MTPGSLDSVRLFPACAAARTVTDACEGICDDLVALGFDMPSAYLLNGQRLRCRAARGYFQVVDGFRPGAGVIGKVVQSGLSDLVADVRERPDFIAAVPGLAAEACAPVVLEGAVVGALSVESRTSLPDDTLRVLEGAAAALARRIAGVGGIPRPSVAQRLAHISIELTAASDATRIGATAVRAALELSGMTTAALVVRAADADGSELQAGPVVGVATAAVRAWSADELAVFASWVSPDTSSHYPGGDVTPPGYKFLRDAGVAAVSVHPLVAAGTITGYFVLTNERPVALAAEVVDCLDLLAGQTAAVLANAAAVEQLAARAQRDELTGLGNRSLLSDVVERSLRSDAGPGTVPSGCISVLLLDLDDFKQVNDWLGHHVGDQVLVQVADTIRRSLRDGDVACRLGGDEFAVVLPGTGTGDAVGVAERILSGLTGAPAVPGVQRLPSASIGVVTELAACASLSMLLQQADAAMYQAKVRGKGSCVVFDTGTPPSD